MADVYRYELPEGFDLKDDDLLKILNDHDLPADHEDARALLRAAITYAAPMILERGFGRSFSREQAQRVLRAVSSLKAVQRACPFIDPPALRTLSSWKLTAEVAMRIGAPTRQPERASLWPACNGVLLPVWRALSDRPDGIWDRDGESPALSFLTACCGLVDPSITKHTIRGSQQLYRSGSRKQTDAEQQQTDDFMLRVLGFERPN